MSKRRASSTNRQEAIQQIVELMYGDGGELTGRRIAARKSVDRSFASEVDSTFDLLSQMNELHDSELVRESIERPRAGPRWGYYAAAATLLVAVLAALMVPFGSNPVGEVDRYVTRVGEQRQIALSDGSRIHLNTSSELLVVKGMETREVILRRGEAYFEIAKNQEVPATVDTGDRKITVLGTAFNVLKENGRLSISVVEGAVAVHKPDDEVLPSVRNTTAYTGEVESHGYRQWRVEAGQVLSVNLEGNLESIAQAETQLEWLGGQLTFHKKPLYLVVKELNRYSARKILIEDESIVGLNVTATVKVDDIGMFFSGLEYSQGIKVVRYPDRIVLVSK